MNWYRSECLAVVLVAGLVAARSAVADETSGSSVLWTMPPLSTPPPPLAEAAPKPRFATAEQARAAFGRNGLDHVQGLEQVGDYWEAEAVVGGKPSAVYLMNDGTLSVHRFPLAALQREFAGQHNASASAVAPAGQLSHLPAGRTGGGGG
jgi:hypothetical protein